MEIGREARKGWAETRRIAFLLSQLGFHASRRFAARLAPLGVDPRHVGVLRAAAAVDGRSQQELAELLGVAPSRMVALIDELESRGLVERIRSPEDRRANILRVTPEGRAALGRFAELAEAHEAELCDGLSLQERERLAALLQRVADRQGLDRDVHPGLQDKWAR